ncbi:MAG: alpha/beta hydrolase [Pseudomonadota bacterium]
MMRRLVLVSGLLCNDLLWQDVIVGLKSQFKETLDITIADTFKDNSIDAMARRLLEDVHDDFWIAGLSMGGFVAQAVLRQQKSRVKGLALLNSSARSDNEIQLKNREKMIKRASFGTFKGIADSLLPMLVHLDRINDRSLCDKIYRMILSLDRDVYIRQQQALANRKAGFDVLSGIEDIPVLILTGREDILTPLELQEEMSSLVHHGQLKIIEQCAHLSTLEQPKQVVQALTNWLERSE